MKVTMNKQLTAAEVEKMMRDLYPHLEAELSEHVAPCADRIGRHIAQCRLAKDN